MNSHGLPSANQQAWPLGRLLRLGLLLFVLAPVSILAKAPSAQGDSIETVEEVEVIDIPTDSQAAPSTRLQPQGTQAPVTKEAHASSSFAQGLWKLLGHLHAAVIHLPIAWSLLWACTEVAVFLAHKMKFDATGAWLSAATVLSFAPAVTSGLLRFSELSELSSDPDLQASGGLHRNLMYAGLGLCVLLCLFRATQRDKLQGNIGRGYAALVVLTTGLIGFSAHLGGVLVYGADFFAL